MAEHYIERKAPANTVVNADVIFEVFGDDQKLGELQISKGGVDWYPRNARQSREFLGALRAAARGGVTASGPSA